jgi:hypothetical protein
VRTLALEFVPTGEGLVLQFLAAADDGEPVAAVGVVHFAVLVALPDGQREPPEPLLGDHPIAHVVQPVHLALLAVAGDPANLRDGGLDLVAPGHRNVPLVHEAVDDGRFAPPAVGVAVGVALAGDQQVFFLEGGDDVVGDLVRGLAGERPEGVGEAPCLGQRGNRRQGAILAEVVVLLPAAGRDVNDARALAAGDGVPGDHAMAAGSRGVLRPRAAIRETARRLLGRQLVERAVVGEPEQVLAHQRLDDLILAMVFEELRQGLELDGFSFLAVGRGDFGFDLAPAVEVLRPDVVLPLALANLVVLHLRMDRRGDVGRQRPRRGGPDEQGLLLPPAQGQAKEHRHVLDPLIALVHLHLADAHPAARTPRHGVEALVDVPAVETLFQKTPDGEVVGLAHRVIRIGPVHPVAQADRLFGLHSRELPHAGLAVLDELVHAVGVDVLLRLEPVGLLHLDLDPQALAVEAVLVSQLAAAHGMVALIEVLQRPPPRVMHTHRIISRDRPVQKPPLRPTAILLAQFLESPHLVPERKNPLLHSREVRKFVHRFVRIRVVHGIPKGIPKRPEMQARSHRGHRGHGGKIFAANKREQGRNQRSGVSLPRRSPCRRLDGI